MIHLKLSKEIKSNNTLSPLPRNIQASESCTNERDHRKEPIRSTQEDGITKPYGICPCFRQSKNHPKLSPIFASLKVIFAICGEIPISVRIPIFRTETPLETKDPIYLAIIQMKKITTYIINYILFCNW